MFWVCSNSQVVSGHQANYVLIFTTFKEVIDLDCETAISFIALP